MSTLTKRPNKPSYSQLQVKTYCDRKPRLFWGKLTTREQTQNLQKVSYRLSESIESQIDYKFMYGNLKFFTLI